MLVWESISFNDSPTTSILNINYERVFKTLTFAVTLKTKPDTNLNEKINSRRYILEKRFKVKKRSCGTETLFDTERIGL